ncbi:MAG TPA: ABC transporter permease [Vicinamibacterales bacterium]|jgi:predicted permease
MNHASSLGRMLRRLLRTPLFTVVALLTLGVGIGANAALFSVVYGVLLKPLPFNEPDRLVGVWHTAPGMSADLMQQGPAFYLTYRDENRTFEQIGLWADRAASVTGAGDPERVQTLMVTDGTLQAVRVKPAMGRIFDRADDTPGSPERIILTFAYWQRKFGGDRSIVGRPLTIDGRPREVIGVLPPSFKFLRSNPAILIPLQFNRAEVFIGNFAYQGVARLKPGVTLEQANADIARMIPLVVERFPLPNGFTRKMLDEVRLGPNVRPLSIDVVGDVGRVLWVLFGMVGIVLLIACANVANLFLVRAEGRQQELAIRSALGADRWRIARELLSESVTLGLAGGVIGAGLAWAAVRLLVKVAPDGLPRLEEIAIDPVVLAFTLAISLVAGLLFGLIPVVKFSAPRIAALKDGGRSASDSRERHRLRSTLVVAEVALAMVLLISSGLMVRTFVALRSVDPGYSRADEVLTLRITIPKAMVSSPELTVRMHEQVARNISQVAGIISVGLSSSVTMDGNTDNDPIFFEDFPLRPGQMPKMHRYKWIGPAYAETMGNKVVAGRTLTWADIYNRTPAALISENLARQQWKTAGAAIGRRIRSTPADPWREIVGVVGDERDDGVSQPAPTTVYWPMLVDSMFGQKDYVQRSQAYAIRSKRLNSLGFMKELQQAVWAVNPGLPLANVRTLNELRAESMAQTSFMLAMLAIAASVALLLGIVGIYGVIAYIAAQRTREVGIRMALGAQRSDVSRLFLRHGLALTGVGLLVGIGVALALTRLMATMLFGIGPTDPLTYVAVSGGLGAVALMATYLPARRASRVDPVVALRSNA